MSKSRTSGAVSSICIVGGGTAGWMAAAVLSKALGRDVAIRLVESDAIGIVGVGEATIPQLRHINHFLGLDEDEFLRETNGSLKLGIQFNNWGKLGDSYLHAFGQIGVAQGLVPFHHYWLRAKAAGDQASLWDYSQNEVASRTNRFGRLGPDNRSPLDEMAYAFHFDAMLYGQYLRRRAEAMGVNRTEGRVVGVRQATEDGFIESIQLENGESVTADLFVDCSGFRGLLIEETLHAGYEDWTHWLPCDRAVAVPCAHGDAFRPYTQATAQKAGWQWRIPLQHRVGNGHVYASAHMSEDEATATLLANIEGEALQDPRPLKFTTGRRKAMWVKNCVALGLASGFMEPLESTSIHLIQSGISRLVTLFPDRRFDESLITEYNRQAQFEFERIRDFLILHYHATERDDTAFWRQCRDMSVPDTLTAKLDLWRASARIVREHEELFTEPGWLQVLVGQRILPRAYHPMADAVPAENLGQFLKNIRFLVAERTKALPSHADFIRQHCAAKAA